MPGHMRHMYGCPFHHPIGLTDLQALMAGAKLANSAPPEDKAKYLEMLAWYVAAHRCSQGSL